MKIVESSMNSFIIYVLTFLGFFSFNLFALVFINNVSLRSISLTERYKKIFVKRHTVVCKKKYNLRPFLDHWLKSSIHFSQFWSAYKLSLKDRLHSAGFFNARSASFFMWIKFGGAFLCAVITTIIALMSFFEEKTSGYFNLYTFTSLAIVCYILPNIYLINKKNKRYQAIQKSLPDTLDLLTICTEAGMSLDASLQRVSLEINLSAPEIAEELRLTSIELSILPERRQALIGLTERCRIPPLKNVVNTLLQAEKYGTSLSHSFRIAANDLREQRMIGIEEKAARLPATLTIPVIVFILPALFIVLVGPAVLDVYDHIIK